MLSPLVATGRTLCRREQQRAAQLELKIAEMTDRAQDFEKMKEELMQRMKQANDRAQQLQRQNDQVCCALMSVPLGLLEGELAVVASVPIPLPCSGSLFLRTY